jgi:hypothetical protein
MGAALLLAFVFHQGVAAVATAVVGTLPALYLAWAVVPAARKPGPRLSLVPAVPGWVDRGELGIATWARAVIVCSPDSAMLSPDSCPGSQQGESRT